jgi:hypothetical protein
MFWSRHLLELPLGLMGTDCQDRFDTTGLNDNPAMQVFPRKHTPRFRRECRAFEEYSDANIGLCLPPDRAGDRLLWSCIRSFSWACPRGSPGTKTPWFLTEQAEPRQFLHPRQRLSPKSDQARWYSSRWGNLAACALFPNVQDNEFTAFPTSDDRDTEGHSTPAAGDGAQAGQA